MTIKSWKVRRRVCIAATAIVVAVWLVLMTWVIPSVVMIVQYLVGACVIGWCIGWYVPEFVNNRLKP